MKAMRYAMALIIAAAAAFICSASAADEDTRERVRLPEDVEATTLGDMRRHMEAFDDVLLSLSVGDFGSAALFAEEQMGLGSHWVKPLAAKRSMVEPWGFWILGRKFRAAASRFALTVTGLGNDRSLEAYKAVLKALREVTRRCRGCHATYRVDH